MDDRAQGALEYILLLAGVLLIVVIAVVILRNNVIPSANTQINQSIGNWRAVVNISCSDNGTCTNLA